MDDFDKKIQDFWDKTQHVYNEFTKKGGVAENTDYYVFQTKYYFNPDLMIVGINPGGDGRNGNADLTCSDTSNYIESNDAWFQTLRNIFGYPENTKLKPYLENAVGANRFFINTGSSKGVPEKVRKSVECVELIRDLVYNIIQPKKIIALGVYPFCTLAKSLSHQKVKVFGDINLKYAKTRGNEIDICRVYNPSNRNKRHFSGDKYKSWQEALEWFLECEKLPFV